MNKDMEHRHTHDTVMDMNIKIEIHIFKTGNKFLTRKLKKSSLKYELF
jgi:hypothetical protein